MDERQTRNYNTFSIDFRNLKPFSVYWKPEYSESPAAIQRRIIPENSIYSKNGKLFEMNFTQLQSKIEIAVICRAVFHFPMLLTGISKPKHIRASRSPAITISRIKIAKAAKTFIPDIRCMYINITIATITINLSAIGSNIFPIIDCTFHCRARYPSRMSVIPANINITEAKNFVRSVSK